ncbi:MAG: Required for respiratory growth protein 9 mitochondrial [Sclerophora amabilis]|nr:MAG: Required for respiratory growth protein 9 mitochondrial [Sclerophora amabilis]
MPCATCSAQILRVVFSDALPTKQVAQRHFFSTARGWKHNTARLSRIDHVPKLSPKSSRRITSSAAQEPASSLDDAYIPFDQRGADGARPTPRPERYPEILPSISTSTSQRATADDAQRAEDPTTFEPEIELQGLFREHTEEAAAQGADGNANFQHVELASTESGAPSSSLNYSPASGADQLRGRALGHRMTDPGDSIADLSPESVEALAAESSSPDKNSSYYFISEPELHAEVAPAPSRPPRRRAHHTANAEPPSPSPSPSSSSSTSSTDRPRATPKNPASTSSSASTTSTSTKPRPNPDRPTWQIQKAALRSKFGPATAWQPRKRLSPDAIEGIRALHAQYPTRFTTPALAARFEVSPEAIRRILKGKWRPSEDEDEARRRRWDQRGEKIWSRMVELGVKPPKKWREMGIGRGKPETRGMMGKANGGKGPGSKRRTSVGGWRLRGEEEHHNEGGGDEDSLGDRIL